MANATAIAVHELGVNGAELRPTAGVLDTGTAAVTLDAAVGSRPSRVVLEVTNTAAAALGVRVHAGENPPAFLGALGDLEKTGIGQNETWVFGPFEAARFAQAGGKLTVTFTPASGTIGAQVQCVRLPVC